MSNGPPAIACPNCGTSIPVAEDWRLTVCPKCGTPVTRMEGDPEYD